MDVPQGSHLMFHGCWARGGQCRTDCVDTVPTLQQSPILELGRATVHDTRVGFRAVNEVNSHTRRVREDLSDAMKLALS